MGASSREHIYPLLAQSDVVRALSRSTLIASMNAVTSSLTDPTTARRCGVVSSTWKTVSIAHCPHPISKCCQPGPRSPRNGLPHLAAVTSGRGLFSTCQRPHAHSASRTQRYSSPARTTRIYGMCQRVVWWKPFGTSRNRAMTTVWASSVMSK